MHNLYSRASQLSNLVWMSEVERGCSWVPECTCAVVQSRPISQYAGTDGNRTVKLLCCGGLAGAVSRTVTAPIDRLKFLSQVHRSSHLTIRQVLISSRVSVSAFSASSFLGSRVLLLDLQPKYFCFLFLIYKSNHLVLSL